MYRLIALDIDGTLIDPEGRVSPANRAAIAEAQAAGTAVVLCTGRSWQESEALAEEAGCGRKLVCQGGAALADLDERRNTRIWEIPEQAARSLTERLEREPLGLMLFAGERVLVNPLAEEIFRFYPCDGYHKIKEVVERPADYLRAHDLPLSKIYAQGDPALFPPILEEVRAFREIDLTTSAPYNFEIVPAGVDKGTGLAALAAGMGIGLEEVIAIGDSDNDRGMLAVAGMPVAMGNADPAIRAMARYVTDTNRADGVAKAIRCLLDLS